MKRYWWVNHKQTFRQEIEGGYLWSPKQERNGARSQFYDNMRRASPGDAILSYAFGQISYIGHVEDYAIVGPKPPEFGAVGASWAKEGWILPVTWIRSPLSARPKDFLTLISSHLPERHSPIHPQTGNGNQKAYLAEINREIYEEVRRRVNLSPDFFLDFAQETIAQFNVFADRLDTQLERKILANCDLSESEKVQLIRARIGQGIFRSNVFQVEKECRLTRIKDPRLLVASHIKPWRSCEHTNERLDGCNGLLLTPHVDLLFDRGLISFNNNGEVMLSRHLSEGDLKRLGILDRVKESVGTFSTEQGAYLEYHRVNVFLS